MQTFLPFPNFYQTATMLDRRRLGKQRVECLQILNAILGKSTGWRNHPATKQWQNNPDWLAMYSIAICDEWIDRGYKDTCKPKIQKLYEETLLFTATPCPWWLGDDRYHSSHRAALLAKEYEWYSKFGWKEEPKIDYFWPSNGERNGK